MAMFSKEDHAARGGARGGGENTLSIISAGTVVSGDIETGGVLKVEGRIEGSVRRARQVMLAKEGAIHGDVAANEVVVGGLIAGGIAAAERLELQSTAVVNGDITTKSIVVMEGARINGAVKMAELALVAGGSSPDAQSAQKTAHGT